MSSNLYIFTSVSKYPGHLLIKAKQMPVTQNPAAKQHKTAVKKNYPVYSIAETLTNGFFTVDNKWTVQYWNPAAEKILRVPAADIVGKNLWQKFEGVIPIELFKVDLHAFLNTAPAHFHEYWAEMGAWFDVTTYHDHNSLSVSFKSSRHQPAELPESAVERLKTITELYRFVTEITNDCLWEWDLDTHEICWIDGGHKRVFGYQVENALVPQSFWEQCIHPDDKDAVLLSLKHALAKKTSDLWEATYRFKTANGNYLYVHDRGHIVRDKHKNAGRMIGATQDITEKTLLEIKLAKERITKQKQITDAVLQAQENEREAIATELNENLNQLLVATRWNIQLAKIDKDKRDDCLQNSAEYLNHVISEIRRIHKTLAMPDMQVIGLFDNIKNLVEDMNKEHSIKFKFTEAGIDEEEDLDKPIQLDIFRMLQQLVSNIIQHAHATAAKINLHRRGNDLVLIVSDNGVGQDKLTPEKGVGIINITSRAELYGGTVTITSKPGKGYTFKVTLPCFNINH
jgi:PAS domain S-box-containing protein